MVEPREVRVYRCRDGTAPFKTWIARLKDKKGSDIIMSRLDRLALGNPGDFRYLTGGVYELRIHFGPGYRVYYAESGHQLILLLCGGDKSSQAGDINQAREYWEDYRRRFL